LQLKAHTVKFIKRWTFWLLVAAMCFEISGSAWWALSPLLVVAIRRYIAPKILTFIVTAMFAFLLYKYNYLQFHLVKADTGALFTVIVVLFLLSGLLSGMETAITNADPRELLKWQDAAMTELSTINQLLLNPVFDRIKLIRWIADRCYYLTYLAAPDLIIGPGPEVDSKRSVALIVTTNDIINVNMAVLLSLCLADQKTFAYGMPPLPLVGNVSGLDHILPLAGSAGFTSVGVSIILLFLAEIVPKRLALTHSIKFVRRSSLVLVFLERIWLPTLLSDCFDTLAFWFWRVWGIDTSEESKGQPRQSK
jgi:hypothetical protein